MKEGMRMNETWNLDIFYKGYDDENFQQDLKKINEMIAELNTFHVSDDVDHEVLLVSILKQLEAYMVLFSKLANYLNLKQSADTRDVQAASYISVLNAKGSNVSKTIASINKFIDSVSNLEEMIAHNDELKEYEYLLLEIKKDAKYQLSDEVEEVISKMNLSGGSAWGNQQSYLTSILEVDYDHKKVTLSEIRNMAYSSDKAVRKAAYEAELAAYPKIADAVSFSLNNIKTQVNAEAKLRGYKSSLDMTLHDSHMKRETLDAMMEAIKDYMPKFHEYLKRKGELLGYEHGLPFYELFAPIGEINENFSIEDTKTYLMDHFKGFSKDLVDMIERAFDEAWIDFYPRIGKVGGAFCENLPYLKQSRILTNFDGSLGDVVTLAHELGHAYHGEQIQDHRMLNTDYSMPVAETASTFNENIIMNAAIDEAQGDEKIALIENQLQDLTQVICDIYCRFLFESAVFENSKSSFMFADQLNEMMLEAQKKAYGDGLDPQYLHPYMWVCKSHYYSSKLSFYNFPYAFGALFARGLIVKYQQEGEAFLPKYKALLKATTISSVEDVALMADIDLTKRDFWNSALDTCVERIDEFLALTKDSIKK